ncbi:putative NRPS-like protein biosynthetic cluster [Dispira simplex]|nr:putative NRPS-like protein biosynthetic cluster [Dispira simplex]
MVPDFFTQHLIHQPHQVALETMDERFTYHECYTHAYRIGRVLLDHGLQPGANLALLFTQSAHYFMAILGTWLVGGVAVPMDATNAPASLQSMVDSLDEGAFLMTRTADDSDQVILPDFYTAKIVMDKLSARIDSTLDLPSCHQDPTTVSLPATCRFLQAVNIAFDGYFMVTLLTWSVGGTLVLHDGELVDDMKQVTHCGLTPSMLGVLNPEDYPQIEVIFSGGEALSYSVMNNWLAVGKQAMNLYGPSETTIACHVDLVVSHESISIGRPIGNTTCYILDDQWNMIPPGVPGQICIGGIGVSSGYWKQHDLTAKIFVDNPFGPGKIYLAGDLGCWLPNGKVHYIGRKDHQVKLRGFRIELGEVESWCEWLDLNIQQAVALVVNKQLVTYLSPKSVDVNEVTQVLKQALPHYMVPAHIIPLDDMPKTRNGKMDRRALAEYPLPQVPSSIGFVEEISSMGDTYQLICHLVQQALQLDESNPLPAPNTSFFSMGGDSISAVQFSTLYRKQGLDVTVANIFKLQTIGAIVALCETQPGEKAWSKLSVPTLFQHWLTDEQRGTVDMTVEIQSPGQSVGILRKPLGFTNSNQWRGMLDAGYPLNPQRNTESEPIDIAGSSASTKWFITPSVFPMFSTDNLYGHYQCTLSEALLAGFLAAWRKAGYGNIQTDLFRMTDNELVSTRWLQDTPLYDSRSPLACLQHVKKVIREATWPNNSEAVSRCLCVLFHMVDPVVGINVTRQSQQRLVPILGSRRRYDLEVMAWYHRNGTITLVIYDESSSLSRDNTELREALLVRWKRAMQNLVECNKGTAWSPDDFPLVPFDNVHDLAVDATHVQTVWPLSSLQLGFMVESFKDPSAYAIQLV